MTIKRFIVFIIKYDGVKWKSIRKSGTIKCQNVDRIPEPGFN